MSIIFEHVVATHEASKSPDRPRTVLGNRQDSNLHFPTQDLTVTVRPMPDGSVELIAHAHGRQVLFPDQTKRVMLSGKREDWKADGTAIWNTAHDLASHVPSIIPNHP
jgi:hypothetical protein